MSKLVFEVDDSSLKAVETILDSIGLDIDIAFNILIKKIIKEKGLPFSVKQIDNASEIDKSLDGGKNPPDDGGQARRSNVIINELMVDEVWNTFKKFRIGVDDVLQKREIIARKTGMNPGSAGIYLNILIKMSKGQMNKRAMKPSDFEYFLKKFKEEQGIEQYRNAIKSVEDSIPYWRTNIPTFANSMESLIKRFEVKI